MFNNSNEVENSILLGKNHRIAVYYDYDAPNPLESADDTIGCFPVAVARGYNGIFSGDREILADLKRLAEDSEAPRREDVENELVAWLEKEHGAIVKRVGLRGHSQGEWMDVVLWMKPEDSLTYATAKNALHAMHKELEDWFRGEVFSIQLEEWVTYHGPNGKTIERYEAVDGVDAVHNYYLQDSRPTVEEFTDLLEIDPTDYGVDSSEVKKLDLML